MQAFSACTPPMHSHPSLALPRIVKPQSKHEENSSSAKNFFVNILQGMVAEV